ncbi:MAG: exodeoxyribonuclease V subunit alpha [Colwellia sp.]
MIKLAYSRFTQAQQQLHDIEAIDYFFAKEMITALCFPANHDFSFNQGSEIIPNELEFTAGELSTLLHLFMALNESLRAGHTCLPLAEIAQKTWAFASDEQGFITHHGFTFSELDTLKSLLMALEISPKMQKIVVYSNEKLSLRRYFQFECVLQQNLKQRLVSNNDYCLADIKSSLALLFPKNPINSNEVNEIDWQKVAVANAINKNFSVIAGGPGTGKTYTVTKLLAALVILHKKKHQPNANSPIINPLKIALAAPTGKAAQRLSESIAKEINGFKNIISDDVLADIPTQAKTIHRLLGVIPHNPNFKHNADNLLAIDVLLIDEVSMVDLALMSRIFRALKSHTKVILLGDADQLPSVAAGSVLADIAPRPHGGFSALNLTYLADVTTITSKLLTSAFQTKTSANNKTAQQYHDYFTVLMKSRRFDGKGGIGLLAKAVIDGNSQQSWQLLTQASENNNLSLADIQQPSQLSLASGPLNTWLTVLVKKYYLPLLTCSDINDAFELLAKFRVLCVTRQGEFGVETINEVIKSYLGKNVFDGLYHAQPIMISENDYRLGLYNGDIGLLWRNEAGHLMANFPIVNINIKTNTAEQKNNFKTLLPSQLPRFETVYAMTIHKTQGSEFSHVAMVLPAQSDNKLLSKELLYTGITRAKKHLTIASKSKVWRKAVEEEVKRFSSLSLS